MPRRCPKNYTMVNGVCTEAVSSQMDVSYINPDDREPCCEQAMYDAYECSQSGGITSYDCSTGWGSNCNCHGWQTQMYGVSVGDGWDDSTTWTSGGAGGQEGMWYCVCSPSMAMNDAVAYCCGGGGPGGSAAGGGGRGWGGRRVGGRIKKRGRKFDTGGFTISNPGRGGAGCGGSCSSDWYGSACNPGCACRGGLCRRRHSGRRGGRHGARGPGYGGGRGGGGSGWGGRGRTGGRIKKGRRR